MSKVYAGWVPGMLTDDQKRTPLNISRYLLSPEDDPEDLSSKMLPKMRHGFTTFTQSQKCRANHGSTLAQPLLRNLRGLIQQGM